MHNHKLSIIIYLLAQMQCTASAQNPGDGLFNSDRIYRIEFTFSQPDWWDSLMTYHENYLSGGNIQYLLGDVKIDAVQTNNVGVRLKGRSSYYQVIDSSDKVSFKIDFNNYVPGQNFDGLRKLNLNNGYNDPTFMREKISLDFLNKQGLFAPRCTYAEVYINGVYWGFYTLVEQIDATFLNSKFGDNNGNLYKASHGGADLSLSSDPYSDDYVLKTNEDINNRSDLEKLIDVINNTSDAKFKDSLEAVLYTNSYIGLWAANNLFVNFDVYEYAANNYYLYNNSFDNKFYWIAWDRNGSFGGGWYSIMSIAEKENLSVYYSPYPPPPPLHERMLQNADYTAQYLNKLCDYLQGDFRTLYLYNQIDALYDMIKPYVYADVNKLYSDQLFENNINFTVAIAASKQLPGLKPFIAARITNVASEIGCLVGTDEIHASGFILKVYPNPGKGVFTVEIYDLRSTIYDLKIYDVLGSEILKSKILPTEASAKAGKNQKSKIDLSGHPAGIYHLQVITDKEIINEKIIIH